MKSALKFYIRLRTKPLSEETKNKQDADIQSDSQNIQEAEINEVPSLSSLDGRKLSLGSYLQEARVNSGQTIHQVSQITKIHTNYIEALEREDYANTPPSIYVKAYIKRLCDLYKIDPNKTLALYENQIIPEDDHKVPETLVENLEKTKQPDSEQEKKLRQYIKYGAIALGVLVILIILFLVFSRSKQSLPIEDKPLTAEQKAELNSDMEKLLSPQSIELIALKPALNK